MSKRRRKASLRWIKRMAEHAVASNPAAQQSIAADSKSVWTGIKDVFEGGK